MALEVERDVKSFGVRGEKRKDDEGVGRSGSSKKAKTSGKVMSREGSEVEWSGEEPGRTTVIHSNRRKSLKIGGT
ncbi:hypothetical protein HK097_002818 [Rhizophlyctis rosea]|uniref:Uncharacterized protein n=1 Tax=Rhizophlyctis rosea TaxID=64517 RepID=A0AAD5S369_9FUNG|nr:hypothetical protein HK097_002818 [Rhizophlyctis rosea]